MTVRCGLELEPQPLAEGGFRGQEYRQDVRGAVTDQPIRVIFQGKEVSTLVTLDATPATAVHTGHGVGGSILDRVPLLAVTRRGVRARSVTNARNSAAGVAPSAPPVPANS